MKIKKTNAILGLLAILILLAHAGYQVIAYILFIYNPLVTKLLGWATVAVVSMHAVLGMSMLMFVHDGSSARSYSGMNLRTILQRAAKAAGGPSSSCAMTTTKTTRPAAS